MNLLDRFARAFRTTDLGASEPPGLAQEDDGTVIYIKPDGSRVEVGGGGSTPVHTHESFSGDYVAVSDGSQATLPWTTSSGPDTLLDITSPTQPNVLESGVYAIMGDTIQNDPITVGGYYIATLTLQGPSGTDQVTSTSPPATALGPSGQYPQAATLVIIRYLTPSDTIELKVELVDGSSDNTFGQSGSIVQRLS
jgi:hypothetical protein